MNKGDTMNRTILLALVLLAGCSAAHGDGPGGAGSCHSPVAVFSRADVDGDGTTTLQAEDGRREDSDSGAGDSTNRLGWACPFGWTYLGTQGGEPVCERVCE